MVILDKYVFIIIIIIIGENFFAPNIFAFNDFGMFIYLRPRPINEFGVQHAIEFVDYIDRRITTQK